MEGNSLIITFEETSKSFKIGKCTLYKMAREGKISAVKIWHGRNNRVIIRIPYNKELLDKVKTIEGRKWNPEEKYWEISYFYLVPLKSDYALKVLKEYFREYKPLKWLFEGVRKGRHISTGTGQAIFKQACEKAGIKKPVSVHSLRHSFVTHLLESGVDLRYIQEILGHKSSKTTEIYTHVSKGNIARIKSPLDSIMEEKE